MRVAILILFGVLMSLNVNALSVASDFLEGGILEVTEGTSKIYGIRLQNTESFETHIKVTYEIEFVNILDYQEEYTVLPKSAVEVKFNVTAPNYNKNNNEFSISYTVHQLTGSGGGLGFLPKINKNFKMRVIKDPNTFRINYYYIAYGIILLAIVFFIYKKKKF